MENHKNMRRKVLIGSVALALAGFAGSAFAGKGAGHHADHHGVVGYLYTTTNGSDINNVVQFSRHADGSLSDEKVYPTGSKGGANVAAGGDAHGDFDTQGAVQIIGNYLLNVNAGGNTISVFSLDRPTGGLTHKTNVDSGGTRPASIAYTKKAGSAHEYWVVVGNQWNNPNIQKDGAKIERYPNNEFFQGDLSQPDASDAERNIQLFTFNAASGVLTHVDKLDTYSRKHGGPTTVSFSPDGKKLAVSTWGIANFNTPTPSTAEQRPSRVYVYDFKAGKVSHRRHFEEEGIAGTIGFTWAKKGSSNLFATNFNLVESKRDNSVTMLSDNGKVVKKVHHFGATANSAINEACWATLNPAGNSLYVASFASNLVSTFNVSKSALKLVSVEKRHDAAPPADSKELWVSPDNKFVYNVGAFKTYTINIYHVNSHGAAVYNGQQKVNAAASGTQVPGTYNFLGLMGYDKK